MSEPPLPRRTTRKVFFCLKCNKCEPERTYRRHLADAAMEFNVPFDMIPPRYLEQGMVELPDQYFDRYPISPAEASFRLYGAQHDNSASEDEQCLEEASAPNSCDPSHSDMFVDRDPLAEWRDEQTAAVSQHSVDSDSEAMQSGESESDDDDDFFADMTDSEDSASDYEPPSGEDVSGRSMWSWSDDEDDTGGQQSEEDGGGDCSAQDKTINYCLFQLMCRLRASENDTDILLATVRALTGRICPDKPLPNIAANHYFLTKRIRPMIDKEWQVMVVCPNLKCSRIYRQDEAVVYDPAKPGRIIGTRLCNHKQFPRSRCCGTALMERVSTRRGDVWRPVKEYYFRPPSQLLRRILARPGVSELCEQWRDLPRNGAYTDVYDGTVWKELQVDFLDRPGSLNLGLLFSFDYFNPLGKGSRKRVSIGKITLAILNLPRHIRYRPENLLRVAILPGPKESIGHINAFLRPIVNDMLLLDTTGLRVGNQLVMARMPLTTMDLMALFKALQFMGHRCRHGCPLCHMLAQAICTQKLEGGGKRQLEPNVIRVGKSFSTKVFWDVKQNRDIDDPIMLKTDVGVRNAARLVRTSDTAVEASRLSTEQGVRFCELNRLPYWRPVSSVVLELQHVLDLGVNKLAMEVLLSPFFPQIGKSLDERVSQISTHMPSSIGRQPTGITEHWKSYKACQFKNFFVYYAHLCLPGLVPEPQLGLLLRLAEVNRMSRKSVLTALDVDHIMMEYEMFQAGFSRIAHNNYTFKMHFMRHYRISTQRHGHLAALTTYGMESDIGWLEKWQYNAKAPLEKQIVRVITMRELATCPIMREEHGIVTNDPDLIALIARLAGDRPDATRASNGDYVQWDTTACASDSPRPFVRITAPPGPNSLCFGHEAVDGELLGNLGLWVLPKVEMQHLLDHVRVNLPLPAQQCAQPALWNALRRNVTVRRFAECRVGSWLVTSKIKATKKQNDPSCVGAVLRGADIAAADGVCGQLDDRVRFGSVQYFFSVDVPVVFDEGEAPQSCELLMCTLAWRKPHELDSWSGLNATVCRDVYGEGEGYSPIIPIGRLVRSVAFVPDAWSECDRVVMLPEF